MIKRAAMPLSDRLVLPVIYDLMQSHEYCTVEQVAELANVSHSTAKRAIKRLRKTGKIKKLAGGRGIGIKWDFPEKHHDYV